MKNPQLILYSLVKNRKLSLKNNVLVFTLLFYIILEVLARAISQKTKKPSELGNKRNCLQMTRLYIEKIP